MWRIISQVICITHSHMQKFSGGKAVQEKAKARLPDVNLDEDSDLGSEAAGEVDEQDGEEEEDGEFFDVLDMLDGRGAEALEEADKAEDKGDQRRKEDKEEEDDDEESEEEDDGAQESDVEMSADEGSIDENAVDGLDAFVTSLDTGKKRKADDAGNEDASRRKRRILSERTQAGPENEFATRAGKAFDSVHDIIVC